VALFAYGVMAINAMEAAEQLSGEYRVNVYDARFAKPVDIELLADLIQRGVPILTLEDHGLTCGFGSCVVDACQAAGLPTHGIKSLGIPERWIYQDSRGKQLAEVGLDAASIARAVREWLDTTPATEVQVVKPGMKSSV
jgi:1-deoxy-D-xylulose-5-phosphate synthase